MAKTSSAVIKLKEIGNKHGTNKISRNWIT